MTIRAKRAALSLLVGISAGLAAALFLFLLAWVTALREAQPQIIWFLPFAGLFIGLIYHLYGKDVAAGHNLILDEIHAPKSQVPLRMAPFVLFGTLATHLFGGSAGREGTAVQMSAAIADQIATLFKTTVEDRKVLLTAGLAAGFGAATGAPIAGAIFGMEVLRRGKFKWFAGMECFIASFVGYCVTRLVHAPHTHYSAVQSIDYQLKTIGAALLLGLFSGLACRFFVRCTHFIEFTFARFIKWPPLKPFLAGLLLVILYQLEGSYQYVGLGLPVIQTSFIQTSPWQTPLLKCLFTALTLGSGFKGGEFIPLVFIGATMGSALSGVLQVSTALLAALGFVSVFAGAANTPIACSILAMELFGPQIGGYALIVCFLSSVCSPLSFTRSGNIKP